jgi:aminoglycoside phosphotransferase (APT) family kinase protein
MLSAVQAKPWTLFAAVKQLADLHHQIHRCAGPGELPSQREWIAGGIDRSTVLSASEKQVAQRALSDLPDGAAICHGDFHPDNVLFSTRGPIVIDWETATRGNPLGDVACTSRLMKGASLPPWSPAYMHWLLRCSRSLLHRSYLKRSFELQRGTRQELQKWDAPLAAAATSWRVPQI